MLRPPLRHSSPGDTARARTRRGPTGLLQRHSAARDSGTRRGPPSSRPLQPGQGAARSRTPARGTSPRLSAGRSRGGALPRPPTVSLLCRRARGGHGARRTAGRLVAGPEAGAGGQGPRLRSAGCAGPARSSPRSARAGPERARGQPRRLLRQARRSGAGGGREAGEGLGGSADGPRWHPGGGTTVSSGPQGWRGRRQGYSCAGGSLDSPRVPGA